MAYRRIEEKNFIKKEKVAKGSEVLYTPCSSRSNVFSHFLFLFLYWGRRDLNPHDQISQQILSLLCLPFHHIPSLFYESFHRKLHLKTLRRWLDSTQTRTGEWRICNPKPYRLGYTVLIAMQEYYRSISRRRKDEIFGYNAQSSLSYLPRDVSMFIVLDGKECICRVILSVSSR